MRHDTAVRLGRTNVEVTALGFGATAIGGMYTEVSEAQAVQTVAAAWDAGLRFFDAAPQYGRGNGEARLGKGLAGYPRDEYVLSSKVGRLLRADAPPNPDDFDPHGVPYDAGAPDIATVYDYSRDGVLRSIEESRARLGTGHPGEKELVHELMHLPEKRPRKKWTHEETQNLVRGCNKVRRFVIIPPRGVTLRAVY